MNLGDLLAQDGILSALNAQDKKQALQQLATRAGETTGINAHDIFTALLQRERLSSTSLGRGIAIPHVKIAGLKKITCFFARLEKPIAFDSHDGEPVDLIFLLLAPEAAGADHLKALARISRLMREPLIVEKLRRSNDKAALYSILTEPASSHAA